MCMQRPAQTGCETASQAEVRGAHEGSVWSFAWHPAGHVLATGAADATTKFWCRARPGDAWRDRGQREQEEGAASEAGAGRGLCSIGFRVCDSHIL